ncbi:MAG TPA: hypothetical protein PLU72_17125 [Candidatus Ozemobacteraceae bacterium]|nr:hypothetical protein [Candidatus Ozemobacteraceae bacterium]
MRTLLKAPFAIILCLGTLTSSAPAFSSDDEQLLAIPSAISEPATSPATTPVAEPLSETLIGLPTEQALRQPPRQQVKPTTDPESLIPLPSETKSTDGNASSAVQPNQDQPPIVISTPGEDAEIVISGQAPTMADQPQTGTKTGLPVFPKDTSSAIFMVMKTWECDNYDGRTLLEHAISVYGKESEDAFSVKGMDALSPFKVTLKESDITLDELLDVVSQKARIDWGVDIEQKTIYFYPTHLQ